MPRRLAALRKPRLNRSSVSALASRICHAPRARPHCRTQASGAISATTFSNVLAHLRHQMYVLMAVDKIGQVAERLSMKAVSCVAISIASSSGCKRRIIAMRIFCVFGRKRPAAQRLETFAHRLERPGERHMQADRRALLA